MNVRLSTGYNRNWVDQHSAGGKFEPRGTV